MKGPIVNNTSKHIGARLMGAYLQIPVWPGRIKLPTLVQSFPSYCPLIEDDEGYVSFVSQESKDRFLDVVNGGCKDAGPV